MHLALLIASVLFFYDDSHLQKAFDFYQKGIEEKNTFLRNTAFNSAVEELLENPSDTLPENVLMGKSLVQLGQYPLAVFYYLNALKKDPANPEIRTLINEAIRLGNLPAVTLVPSSFGPPSWMLGSVLLLIFMMLFLWIGANSPLVKKGALLACLPLSLGFLILLTLVFRSPILGVIIHADIPLQEPYKQAGPVRGETVASGEVVTVLDVAEKGSWVKMRTASGLMGYVPESAIRIVK